MLARCALVPTLLRLLPRACTECDCVADTRLHSYHGVWLCAQCRVTPRYHMMRCIDVHLLGLSDTDRRYMHCAYLPSRHDQAPIRLYFHADVQRALRDKYADLDYATLSVVQRANLSRARTHEFDLAREAIYCAVEAELCERHSDDAVLNYMHRAEFHRLLLFDGDHRRPETIQCRHSLQWLVNCAHAYIAAHGHL